MSAHPCNRITVIALCLALAAATAPLAAADFRYSLPWWQTAICLHLAGLTGEARTVERDVNLTFSP